MTAGRWMRSIKAFLPHCWFAQTSRGWCRRWNEGWCLRRCRGKWGIAETFNQAIASSVRVVRLLHSHSKSQWKEEEEDDDSLWQQHDCSSFCFVAQFWIGKKNLSLDHAPNHFSARWKKMVKKKRQGGPTKGKQENEIWNVKIKYHKKIVWWLMVGGNRSKIKFNHYSSPL